MSAEIWAAAQRGINNRRGDAGKARPINRSLLASLLVCKRCNHSFVHHRGRPHVGPKGDGHRYYICSGYHRYGKAICGGANIPGLALDAFVLRTIKRVLLGDRGTTKQAIDTFVAAVLTPRAVVKPSKSDNREWELLNRKIKATVAMLADPAFDGLDELRTILADLKVKRDALEARRKAVEQPATPALSDRELRAWALQQFARLDDLVTRTTIDLKDRQMVEAFVQRIEINPENKTGVVYLLADLESALHQSSTRVPHGEGWGGGKGGTVSDLCPTPCDSWTDPMLRLFLPTSVLLASIALLVFATPLSADVTLVKNGEPRAALFVPARLLENAAKTPEKGNIWKSHDQETQRRRLRESVRDFVGIVERISGAKLEIVSGPPAAGEQRIPILVGELATEKFGSPQKSAPYGQGLRIVVKGNAVGLIGEGDLGTSYAIYTLLHKLGCRWYMPSSQGEVLPALKTITLADQDFSEAPYTIFRGIWYCDNDYARRNRMGGMELSAGHALEGSVPKELRKTHPEIRAIIKGKPHDRLVKWTHPLVAQGISETIFKRLEKDPEHASFSLSPDDGMGWDESDDAKLDAGDFDPTAGAVSKTDRLMVLGNRVAKIVTAKFPHVKFGILAYVDYTRPPVREKVDPAIVPEIAPIAFSRGHPMNDPKEPNNATLRELVEGWAKIVPATSYYFYGYNLAETGTPNPMLAKWGFDVPYVIEKGKCRYWQPETIPNFESCLQALYMSNRLAWDPSEKPEAVYAELYDKFYGHAAKSMSAYWQAIDDMWTQSPEYSGCGFGHLRRFTPERLSAAEKLLHAAETTCQTDAEKFRVEMARQSFDELQLFMKLRRDLAEGRFEKLAEDGTKYMKVMDELGAKYRPQFAFGTIHWTRGRSISSRYFRFYHQTYEDASRIAKDFTILTTPPLREWKYQADKDQTGDAAGWAQEKFDDAAWKTTDCPVETWSTLGLHNYMGSLWYRRKVSLPEIPSGKKVHLWIGATDGRVKVFVNGQAIPYVNPKGETADSFTGYTKPVSFDITGALKKSGENQIALFCTREFLNEAGTGGLIAPVAIYRDK